MQKVVGIGSLYFVLAVIDGVFRIMGVNIHLNNFFFLYYCKILSKIA
jgi:hypothetical protein